MLKKERGFTVVEPLLVALVIAVIAGTGLLMLHKHKSSVSTSSPTASQHSTQTLTKSQAFTKLQQAYADHLKDSQKDCASYEVECLSSSLSTGDKFPIAVAYSITNDEKDSIYFGLEHGNALDIGGIGTGYLNNKATLMINDNDWYWEIGACGTNNRIFINADTGATSGIHSWTYCSHNVDELSAP